MLLVHKFTKRRVSHLLQCTWKSSPELKYCVIQFQTCFVMCYGINTVDVHSNPFTRVPQISHEVGMICLIEVVTPTFDTNLAGIPVMLPDFPQVWG